MDSDLYVFSDESGTWHKGNMYVRSWVCLDEDQYLRLKGKMALFRELNGLKNEIKFNENHNYSMFLDLNFTNYYSVSFVDQILSRNLDLVKYLETADESLFVLNKKDIRDIIVKKTRHMMFLHIFEYHHMQNAIRFFDARFAGKTINFLVDTPQANDKEWKAIFKKLETDKFTARTVKSSENYDGILFADIVAGNVRKILENLDSASNMNSFERKLIKQFSQRNGPDIFKNNPQIVMWHERYLPFVKKMTDLINEYGGDTVLTKFNSQENKE